MQVEKKYPRNSGCSVPDVVKQKSAFHETYGSQRNMCKSKLGKLGLLTIALCTLNSNI